jgi:hypothetical protein
MNVGCESQILEDMKVYFFSFFIIWTISSFGQTNQTSQKGNYFKTTSSDYFERVLKPWKYEYDQTQVDNTNDSVKKVGQITFWRSEAIYDNVSKEYWKPHISYDVYLDTDSAYIKNLSDKIRLLSSCDTINKGGDILFVGHFILVSPSACVNCTSSSNIDYCRNIIKCVLESVPNKDTYDWNAILKQFIIDKAKFKT